MVNTNMKEEIISRFGWRIHCVLILFFLQCIPCSARTHVLKMLGLAITEYTSLMVTVKTSHGYKFRVGFMNQEDRCFFYGRTWINFLKCYGLKVGARMLMEIAEPGLIFTAIFHPDVVPIVHPC